MNKQSRYMLRQNLSYYKNRIKYGITKLHSTVSDNYIVFESYGGKKATDSVRAIYDELQKDEKFRSFYFVWAFTDPAAHFDLLENHHTILVKKGTSAYRRYYASARYWINNITVADYLKPRKTQIYIETWHGTPLKRLGCDIETDSDPRQTRSHMHRRYRAKGKKVTFFPSPSPYYSEKIASAFAIGDPSVKFVASGYPRNDKLFHYTSEEIQKKKEALHIPEGKKVLLYTPTWRDSSLDENGAFSLPDGFDVNVLMDMLGSDYILLFRAHHQIGAAKIKDNPVIYDVSDVESVNDLYLVSDLMITDYSSTMFDYANLMRPMVFHMYDADSYEQDVRGLYLSPEELPGPITKTEQELVDARDKAEESNRLKSAFLANMSHEIRTPLNAIVGFAGLLNSTDENEERNEYVKIIENNNELLLQLIGDILDLSKIEAGTLEFAEVPVDVNALLEEVTKSLQLRAEAKNLTVVFKDRLPECSILTDRNRLNQVLINLITNSIKFTETGGITVGYTLQKDGLLRFYVTDTGCGIAPEKQADIFTRFVKLDNFTQGTGLGLSICKTIVNRMGGEIGVESEPGKGSTFWFTIRNVPAELNKKRVQEYTLQAVAKDQITILIAEDNISNFKLFETILKKDYRILHAWNGEEAVNLFKAHRPHIVLMDVNMPVMDGYEATAEIRKISADVPILAVTAYAYASDEQRILSQGFDGYTAKPINPHVLRSKIVDLLSTRLLLL